MEYEIQLFTECNKVMKEGGQLHHEIEDFLKAHTYVSLATLCQIYEVTETTSG